MNFPKQIKKGDTIAVIATSSPVAKEQVDACEQLVKDMGYHVIMGDCTYKGIRGYSAGTGAERAEEINKMFADKNVDAIWCIRGGDTSSHTMDKLDYEMIKANPKIFVGYSDVTNYHINFNQKCDLVTFHGPMVKSNMLNDYDEFTKMSFEKAIHMDAEITLDNPVGEAFKVMYEGKAEGIIIGGNLALVTSMIGTPYEIDTKGKILFIEDVGENVTRLDRMMYQLKYAGKLEDAVGFVIGDFADCNNPNRQANYEVHDMLKEVLEEYNKPVIYNVKSGHCSPMSTIPLGLVCKMDTETKTIKFNR